MDAGNRVRKDSGRDDFMALYAISDIGRERSNGGDKQPEPIKKRAWLIWSLKRPEEVVTLRRVYGEGFFLIGVFSPEDKRSTYLQSKSMSEDQAKELIEADQKEEDVPSGQRTSKTFHLADVFVDLTSETLKADLDRFVDLVFGQPFTTPRFDEYAMFLAYGASLRSADLSRQVGAVVASRAEEIVSVGANDVPKAGGGLYWPGDRDERDHKKGHDSNEVEREKMLDDVLDRLKPVLRKGVSQEEARKYLEGCRILDITEFGRAVHAELEAILSAGRSGVSIVGGALFATTFPCHNCAKHIVASGLNRVSYIEPYPKSQAENLHKDAIVFGGKVTIPRKKEDGNSGEKPPEPVVFSPFVGIGPRRFFDLFSLALSSGRPIQRKKKNSKGEKSDWKPENAELRVPLSPLSYLEREKRVTETVESVFAQVVGSGNDAQEEQDRRE
ncbi:MAG: cytidine deaminase [Deltaproteobacteria bacterium]|nr:MAG: cytidine deaminase [Deltaproteobacteria bacterium]